MKTSPETTEILTIQPINSQSLRTQFEAQFETQSQIRNELSAKPFIKHFLQLLLNKNVDLSPIDVAHQEAIRVNEIVEELLPYNSFATAQMLASVALSSSEFELKNPEELYNKELVLRYCPEAAEHINMADLDTAHTDLNRHIFSRKMSKHNKRALRNGLYLLTADRVDTAISSGDTQTMEKLITKNQLRHIGYFEGLIKFPKEILYLESVQKSIEKSFKDCVSFEYDSNLAMYVSIIRLNNLLPEHRIQEILKARPVKELNVSNLATPAITLIKPVPQVA